jgi:hypothetical protein
MYRLIARKYSHNWIAQHTEQQTFEFDTREEQIAKAVSLISQGWEVIDPSE